MRSCEDSRDHRTYRMTKKRLTLLYDLSIVCFLDAVNLNPIHSTMNEPLHFFILFVYFNKK